MAGASDIRAGRAYVELMLKDAALRKGLSGMRSLLQNFVAGFGIGAGIASWDKLRGAITSAITSFMEGGDHIAKLSQRTGIGTRALSELGYAAQLSGSDIDTLVGRLGKMQKTIGGAFTGAGDSAKALHVLGIGLDQLRGKTPDEQFEIIAEAISKIKDPAIRAKRATDIFGKGALDLMPLLEKGAKGIRAYREEAKELGFSKSPESAKMAEALKESSIRFEKAKAGIFVAIGSALAAPMKEALDYLTRITVSVKNWVAANAGLIQSIAKLATMAVVTATAIGFIGAAMFLIAKGGSVVGLVLSLVGAAALKTISPFMSMGRTINGVVTSGISGFRRLAASAASMAASVSGASARIGSRLAVRSGQTGLGVGQIGVGLGQIGLSAGMAAGLSLGRGIAAGVVAAGPSIIAGARASAAGIGSALTGAAALAGRALAPVGTAILSKLAPVWQKIGPGFRSAFFSAAITVLPAIDKIRSAFGPIASAAAGTGRRLVSAFATAGPAIARGLVSAVSGAFSRIRTLGAATTRSLAAGAANIGRGAGNVLSGIAGIAGTLSGVAGGALGGLFGGIATAVPNVLALGGAFAGLLSPVGLVLAAIAGGVYAWTQFSDSGRAAFANVMAAIKPLLDTFMATFQGIKDALSAGDLALAGRIAILGLKVAFVQGLSAIADAVGGQFGAMIGKLGSQILSGDLTGAWNTAVAGMAAVWETFSSGIVRAFSKAIKSIIAAWKSATIAIADWLLKDAANGGILGRAALVGTGVNMKDQKSRDTALEQQRRALLKNRLDQQRGRLADAEANGGTATDETGREVTADDLRRVIADLENSLGMAATDFLGQAQQAAADQIGATADAIQNSIGGALNAVQQQADENLRKAQEKLDAALGSDSGRSGRDILDPDLQKREDELMAAKKAAADGAAAQKAKDKAAAEKAADAANGADPAVLGKEVTGSFSAAALAAGGSTSAPIERVAKAAENQLDIAKQNKELTKLQNKILADSLDQLKAGGVVK